MRHPGIGRRSRRRNRKMPAPISSGGSSRRGIPFGRAIGRACLGTTERHEREIQRQITLGIIFLLCACHSAASHGSMDGKQEECSTSPAKAPASCKLQPRRTFGTIQPRDGDFRFSRLIEWRQEGFAYKLQRCKMVMLRPVVGFVSPHNHALSSLFPTRFECCSCFLKTTSSSRPPSVHFA